MKLFKKGKANSTFIKEVDAQRTAAEIGVAPCIIDFYVGGTDKSKGAQSYIVMEKCDQTVLNVIESQKGQLTDAQWEEIRTLYTKLETIPILHNDSNIMNLMMKWHPVCKFYLIDFGMSKRSKGNLETCFTLMRKRLISEEERVAAKHNSQ